MATLMICLFSAWLVAAHSEDTASHFAARCWGGVLMGVFFQQSGWLCHEICHHQCFKNRIHGKFLGYFWGNCAQGFSVACGRTSTARPTPCRTSTATKVVKMGT